jgi:hypothetical protein
MLKQNSLKYSLKVFIFTLYMYNSSFSYVNLAHVPTFIDTLYNNDPMNVLKLTKILCKSTENKQYSIIRYDKSVLSNDLIPSYGLCRSIIVNDRNKVVAYSPSKSMPFDTFKEKYPDNSHQQLTAQEFVEGTMINVFWDDTIGLAGGWEIATRNSVGANCVFFQSKSAKTFRTMFLEAAAENNLILNNLSKQYCFSFVLQHPDNRIVTPFKKPQLYLIAAYYINHISDYDIEVYNNKLSAIKDFDWTNTTIKFPEVFTFTNYDELINKYASMNTPYNIMGVVIINEDTVERTKIRNPVYTEIKALRGNQPKLQYQYISLRKQGKVKDYLTYYAEHKGAFNEFKSQIHNFTNMLTANYIACYIKKENPLLQFPTQYRTHMFKIHQTYINELLKQKLYVNRTMVINYVNNMDTALLMHSLNYNYKKRNIDILSDYSI